MAGPLDPGPLTRGHLGAIYGPGNPPPESRSRSDWERMADALERIADALEPQQRVTFADGVRAEHAMHHAFPDMPVRGCPDCAKDADSNDPPKRPPVHYVASHDDDVLCGANEPAVTMTLTTSIEGVTCRECRRIIHVIYERAKTDGWEQGFRAGVKHAVAESK